jgi:hypothetical protein
MRVLKKARFSYRCFYRWLGGCRTQRPPIPIVCATDSGRHFPSARPIRRKSGTLRACGFSIGAVITRRPHIKASLSLYSDHPPLNFFRYPLSVWLVWLSTSLDCVLRSIRRHTLAVLSRCPFARRHCLRFALAAYIGALSARPDIQRPSSRTSGSLFTFRESADFTKELESSNSIY